MAKRAVFALFVACLFASLFWLVHPWYDLTVDGSVYIVTARSLAAGEGYRYLGEPFQVRPPGFPLLIVPFVSGLADDFFAINFFVACFGAAGVLLLFWHARPRLGFGLALLVAAAVWLNPNYQRLSTQVMSDVPGTTLLLLCLLARALGERPAVVAARDRAGTRDRSLGVRPDDRDPAGPGHPALAPAAPRERPALRAGRRPSPRGGCCSSPPSPCSRWFPGRFAIT